MRKAAELVNKVFMYKETFALRSMQFNIVRNMTKVPPVPSVPYVHLVITFRLASV
jgi:hypothetical protein